MYRNCFDNRLKWSKSNIDTDRVRLSLRTIRYDSFDVLEKNRRYLFIKSNRSTINSTRVTPCDVTRAISNNTIENPVVNAFGSVGRITPTDFTNDRNSINVQPVVLF